jgi:hypothetical protein
MIFERPLHCVSQVRIQRPLVVCIACLYWSGFIAAAGWAMESDTGEKALRRGTSAVWVEYENQKATVPDQQLKRSDYSDRHDSIYKDSGTSWWTRWLEGLRGSGSGNGGLADFFSWVSEVWRFLIYTLLAIILIALLFFLFRSEMFQAFIGRRRVSTVEEDIEQQRVKVSDLPFELEQPLVGLRAQAERLRNFGDYSKAIVYLYSYLLVELDQANCIRLERGKTNGVYIRELASWPALDGYMKPTVRLFELAYFGRREIDRGSFENLWSKITLFEETLAQIRAGKLSEDKSITLYADSLPGALSIRSADVGGAI